MAEEYPLIRRYGKYLRRAAGFVGAQIDIARATNAPEDAVFYFNGKWFCADDIKNENTREALGLKPLSP